jgi:hypothetical protein
MFIYPISITWVVKEEERRSRQHNKQLKPPNTLRWNRRHVACLHEELG